MGAVVSGCVRRGGDGARGTRGAITCDRGGCEVPESVHKACGPVGNLLFETEATTNDSFQYVGQGKGGYSKLDYVSRDEGSEDAGSCSSCKKCFSCIVVLLLVAALGYVTMVGDTKDGKKQLEELMKRAEAALPESMSNWTSSLPSLPSLPSLTSLNLGSQDGDTVVDNVPPPVVAPESIVSGHARRYSCATGATEQRASDAVYSEWDATDLDHDGQVSREEIMAQKDTLSSQSLEKLLTGDKDKSGSLSFEEFAKVLSSSPLALEDRRLRGATEGHGSDLSLWTLDKRRWCCDHWAVACDGLEEVQKKAAVAGRHFDCAAGLGDWMEGWTDTKKTYCCEKTKNVGCPPAPPKPHADRHKAGNETEHGDHGKTGDGHDASHYDCEVGVKHWREGWQQEKKDWCCRNKKVACSDYAPKEPAKPSKPAPPAKPAVTFECSGRASLWTQDQQKWCCSEKRIGCADAKDITVLSAPHGNEEKSVSTKDAEPAAADDEEASGKREDVPPQHTKTTAGGCNTMCNYRGRAASCTERISWLAKNQLQSEANSCAKSMEKVLEECPMCSVCSVAETGCEAGGLEETFDCDKFLTSWKFSWSSEKKRYCCKTTQKGCEEGVVP